MSLPVMNLVEDAAVAIGDPNKTRVKMAEWTSFYNRASRELAAKADVCQYRSTFNLGAQAAYHYPDEMRRLTGIEVTDAPVAVDETDLALTEAVPWRQLREMFEDEHRAATSHYYSNADLPESYFADVLGFYLYPRPSATIVNGGRMTFFGMPDRITDAATATFQLVETAQDLVLNRMIVFGKMARNRIVEAEAELKQWYSDVGDLQDALTDRSDDRRSSLAPRRNRYAGMR